MMNARDRYAPWRQGRHPNGEYRIRRNREVGPPAETASRYRADGRTDNGTGMSEEPGRGHLPFFTTKVSEGAPGSSPPSTASSGRAADGWRSGGLDRGLSLSGSICLRTDASPFLKKSSRPRRRMAGKQSCLWRMRKRSAAP